MFALSFVVERVAMMSRVQAGPTYWQIPLYGIVLFFLGNLMRGASLVMLVSRPLRMPVNERLFQVFWMGPVGRWLLRGDDKTPVGRTIPPTLRPTPIIRSRETAIVTPPPSMEDVQRRLKALEDWRSSLG